MLCYSPHKNFIPGYCIVQNPYTLQSISFEKAKAQLPHCSEDVYLTRPERGALCFLASIIC